MEALLQKLLEVLDGNKTVLGLVLLQVADYLPEPYSTYCKILGGILTGTGVVAKGLKMRTAFFAKPEPVVEKAVVKKAPAKRKKVTKK